MKEPTIEEVRQQTIPYCERVYTRATKLKKHGADAANAMSQSSTIVFIKYVVMTSNNSLKLIRFFEQAKSFYDAYKALLKEHFVCQKAFLKEVERLQKKTGQANVTMTEPFSMSDLMIPLTVNAAFALELHLKLLLTLLGKSEKKLKKCGHDIRELVELLPPDELKILQSRHYGSDMHFTFRILQISRTFYDARYPYESKARQSLLLDPFFMETLIETLQIMIIRHAPNMAVFFKQ